MDVLRQIKCLFIELNPGGNMLGEFKKFILKGNVMDLAVGVIIGGAFSAIVKSLVDDVLMPIIGAIFGGLDFSNYFAPLADSVTATSLEAAKEQGAVLAYGNFITAVINFLIMTLRGKRLKTGGITSRKLKREVRL